MKNSKYDGYRRALGSMVYKCFEKKTRSRVSVNQNLAVELHKPAIKILKGCRIFARIKDNVWVADLAEMGSLSSKNKNIKYSLRVIHFFTKYSWVKKLKSIRKW